MLLRNQAEEQGLAHQILPLFIQEQLLGLGAPIRPASIDCIGVLLALGIVQVQFMPGCCQLPQSLGLCARYERGLRVGARREERKRVAGCAIRRCQEELLLVLPNFV